MSNFRGDFINPFEIPFDSINKNVDSFCNMMSLGYLKAIDNSKYEKDWKGLIRQLQKILQDPVMAAKFPKIDPSVLYSDKTLDPKNKKAKKYYMLL